MRSAPTDAQIAVRCLHRKAAGAPREEWEVYLPFVPLEEGRALTGHEHRSVKLDRRSVQGHLEMEMGQAWAVAKECDETKVELAMYRLVALVWLLGNFNLSNKIERDVRNGIEFFGKDLLREICEEEGLDADRWDDGVRVNSMMEYFDKIS